VRVIVNGSRFFAATIALVIASGWPERSHLGRAGRGRAAGRGWSRRPTGAVTLSGKGALLFLLALLLLSALGGERLLRVAAIQAARLARGDGHALYRNVFLLGSAVTMRSRSTPRGDAHAAGARLRRAPALAARPT